MSGWRKLPQAYLVERATPRSQALGGLQMFGPMTTEALSRSFGVSREVLMTLEAEQLVERAGVNDVEWWRLREVEGA